jgi:hypothetical protein
MASTEEMEKHALVEAAASMDKAGAEFVRTFYRNVPPGNVLSREPSAL